MGLIAERRNDILEYSRNSQTTNTQYKPTTADYVFGTFGTVLMQGVSVWVAQNNEGAGVDDGKISDKTQSGPDFSVNGLKGKSKNEIEEYKNTYLANVNNHFQKYGISITDVSSVETAINTLNSKKSELKTQEDEKIKKINDCDEAAYPQLHELKTTFNEINNADANGYSNTNFESINNQIKSATEFRDKIDQTQYSDEYNKADKKVTDLKKERTKLKDKLVKDYKKKIEKQQETLKKDVQNDTKTQEKNIDDDIKLLGKVKKGLAEIEEAKANSTESITSQQGDYNNTQTQFITAVNNTTTPKETLKAMFETLETAYNGIHGNKKSFEKSFNLCKSMYEKAMQQPNRPESEVTQNVLTQKENLFGFSIV